VPQVWQELLEGLHVDDLPEGEPLPLDLGDIEGWARERVNEPRVWSGLCAAHGEGEALEVTAARFNVTRERMRQMQLRALRQLTYHSRGEAWVTELSELSQQPRALLIPRQMEAAWAVLVYVTRLAEQNDLCSKRLADGLWVLFQMKDGYTVRGLGVPTGRYYQEVEAAALMGVSSDALRVAWPAMNVYRTRDGRYVQRQEGWRAVDWLLAVAGALADGGHDTWEEPLLFAAVRSLPGSPDVRESTLR